MTTPSHPSPEDLAREIAEKIVNESRVIRGARLVYDHDKLLMKIAAALHAHGLAKRRAGAEKMLLSVLRACEMSMKVRSDPNDYHTVKGVYDMLCALPLPGDDRE